MEDHIKEDLIELYNKIQYEFDTAPAEGYCTDEENEMYNKMDDLLFAMRKANCAPERYCFS